MLEDRTVLSVATMSLFAPDLISDTALTPSEFLNAKPVPEPGTFGLMAVCAGLALVRRSRRA